MTDKKDMLTDAEMDGVSGGNSVYIVLPQPDGTSTVIRASKAGGFPNITADLLKRQVEGKLTQAEKALFDGVAVSSTTGVKNLNGLLQLWSRQEANGGGLKAL